MYFDISSYRRFQLNVMGLISLAIGPLTLFVTTVIYKLPILHSISESATIANKSSPILPYCLGALSLYALSYAFLYRYDILDTVVTGGMFVGFTLVAMQMCSTPYVEGRVGVLGLPVQVSNIVHDVGAIIGFGNMILWILICFRQSDVPKELQTAEKRLRNRIYLFLGICMIASLSVFLLRNLVSFELPTLFIAECLMLTFGGLACLIKGGLLLSDGRETFPGAHD